MTEEQRGKLDVWEISLRAVVVAVLYESDKEKTHISYIHHRVEQLFSASLPVEKVKKALRIASDEGYVSWYPDSQEYALYRSTASGRSPIND